MKTKIKFGLPGNRVAKILALAVCLLVPAILFYGGLFGSPNAHAATGINQQLNFQGRLATSTGAIVADGTYNMEFKIYQDGTGCVSGGTSPCSGTLEWTEDWIYGTGSPDNRVTVKNGYFSVNLGSICTLSGGSCQGNTNNGVNWNSDTNWISINIGNTTTASTFGGASGDGEMLPFKRLTATPYALNSNTLQGFTPSSFVQLAPSAVQTDTSTTLASIFVNKNNASGTPNILELQKASSDVFVVNNSGNVTLGAASPTISSSTTNAGLTLQANGNGTLLLDSGSSGVVTVGSTAATVNVCVSATCDNLNIGTGGDADTIAIGDSLDTTSLNGSTVALVGGTGGSAITLTTGASAGTAGGISIGNTTGANTQAISIGTNGTASSTTNVTIGSIIAGSTQIQSASGLILGKSSTTNGDGTLVFDNHTGANTVTLQLAANPGSSYTLKLPTTAPALSQCLQNDGSTIGQLTFASCGAGGGGVTSIGTYSSSNHYNDGASISGTALTLGSADATHPGLIDTGAQTFAGAKTFQTSSTAALQIQNASASANAFTADTTNSRIGINTFSPLSTLDVGGNATIGGNSQNLLTFSEQLDNAAWATSSVTVTANTTVAPNGTTTAETATPTATGHLLKQNVTTTGSTNYTFSWWAKSGTMTTTKYSVFDNTNSADIISSTAYTTTGAWQRFSVSFTTPSNTTSVGVYVLRDSGVTGTVFLWGAQVVSGNSAGTYTQTTGSTVSTGATALSTQGGLSVNTIGSNNILQLQQDGKTVANVGTNGATSFENSTNSTTAFQIQNTSGTNVFDADTTNSIISLGANTPYAMKLPGVSGAYASTPDSTANSITGDIDLQARVALNDWTPSASQNIIGKHNSSFSYQLAVLASSGVLHLTWSANGSTLISSDSTVAPTVTDGQTLWVRATLKVNNGASGNDVKFYTAPDSPGIPVTWTQLGTTVTTAGTTSIFNSTDAVEIGSFSAGTGNLATGTFYRALIYNGIAGTLANDFDPSRAATTASTTFTASTGETWTRNGTATFLGSAASTFGPNITNINSAAVFHTNTDSTAAFQIQSAAGGTLFNADTVNNQITVQGNLNLGTHSGQRFISDGFEGNNDTSGKSIWDMGDGGVNSATDTNTIAHTGAYSLGFSDTGGGGSDVNGVFVTGSGGGVGTVLYQREWVYLTSLGGTGPDRIMGFDNGAGNGFDWNVFVDPSTKNVCVEDTVTDRDCGGTLTLNAWHSVEVYVNTGSTSSNGVTSLWLDGTLLGTTSGINNGSGTSLGRAYAGNNYGGGGPSIVGYIDDFVASDFYNGPTVKSESIDENLHVAGSTSLGQTIVKANAATAFQVSNDNNIYFQVGSKGNSGWYTTIGTDHTVVRPVGDNTSAFQIQNSSGSGLLNADTTNGQIQISANSSSTQTDQLLISQSGTGDAAAELQAANGTFYVGVDNSNSASFEINSATAASGGSSVIMGDQTISSNDGNNASTIYGSPFTAGSTGTVVSLTVDITQLGTTNHMETAIYTDNGGEPGTLISSSSQQTLSSTGLVTFPISASITSGTTYWFVLNTDDNNVRYAIENTSGGPYNRVFIGQTYGTWPTLNTYNGNTTANLTIYATVSTNTDNFANALVKVGQTGQTAFQNSANSSSAFNINNATGSTLFGINTSNSTGNNMIADPSFESSGGLSTNWQLLSSATISQVTSQAYEQTHALKIAASTAANDGAKYNLTGGNILVSGTTYTLSAYVSTDSSTSTLTDLEIGHADNGTAPTFVPCLSSQIVDTGWTRFTCTWTSGTITGTPFVYFRKTASGTGTSANLYIDDIQLQTDANATPNFRNGTLNLAGTVINSPVVLQGSQNSTNAFQVQDAIGTQVFNVDTTDTNLITNPGFEANAAKWTAVSSGAIRRDTTQSYSGIGSLQVVIGSAATGGSQYSLNPPVTVVSTNYEASFYSILGSGTAPTFQVTYSPNGVATVTCSPGGTDVTGGWTRFSCLIASGATTATSSGFLKIAQTNSAISTWYIDGVQLEAAASPTNFGAGAISFNGVITTPTIFQSKSNSTTAFQIQNASGSNLLAVDTTNTNITLTSTSTAATLLNITNNSATTNNVATLSATALTSGSGLIINGPTSGSTLTGNLFDVNTASTGAAANGFVRFQFSGNHTGNGLQLDDSALAGVGLAINALGSAQTTESALKITQTNTTTTFTGSLVNLTGSFTTGTGSVLGITSVNTSAGAGLSITASSLTAGGVAVKITAATAGKALQFGTSGSALDLASGTNGNTFVLNTPQLATTTACGASGSAQGLIIKTFANVQAGHWCISGPTATTANALSLFENANNTGSTDLAENYSDINNDLSPGEVVCLDPNASTTAVVACSNANDPLAFGIVSTSPGLLMTGYNEDGSYNNLTITNPVPVALSGRVPTNVNTENGPIAVGDYLTASSTPGVAMKATQGGIVVGQTLESYSGSSTGTVFAMVDKFFNSQPNSATAASAASTSDLTNLSVQSANVALDMNVFGTLFANGALTVQGKATFLGDVTLGAHVTTNGNKPITQLETGAGLSSGSPDNPNANLAGVTLDGNDTSGQFSLALGDNSSAGKLLTVKFNKAFAKAPHVFLSANNDQAAGLHYFVTATADGFTISTTDSNLPAASQLDFNYWIVQ